MTESTSRRAVLLGAGVIGAAGLLAACGSDGGTPTPAAAPPVNGAPTTTGADQNVIKVADIPVGGGKVYPDLNVVVTQPVAGQFKAFNATCKHMGCTVGDVSNGKINCPCHGSQYNITDGVVTRGPSTQNLDPMTATVNGTTVVVS